jgi:hypothetical protein
MANQAINLQPAYVNGTFCFAVIPASTAVVTFNIVPSDATLTITSGKTYTQSGNKVETDIGQTLGYSVSKSGYTTKTGTITIDSKQVNVTVAL